MRDEVRFVFQAAHSCTADRLDSVRVKARGPRERAEQWTGLLWVVGREGKNLVVPGFQVLREGSQGAAP